MAAPAHITLGDLSGDWVMNRQLSDSTEPMLSLQGIPKAMRTILNMATMTLHISQYTGEDNNTHIDVQNTVTGGINATAEYRTLDWTERSQKNAILYENSLLESFTLAVPQRYHNKIYEKRQTDIIVVEKSRAGRDGLISIKSRIGS
jgi:hypothetical protein